MTLTPSDLQFAAEFEEGRMPAGGFHHADHIRLCWIYLRQGNLVEVLDRLSRNLLAFATAQGKPGLYHATITWGFTFAIHERMGPPDETWEQFAASHRELFDWKPSVLDRYYTEATLESDAARAAFVLPDRLSVAVPAERAR